MDYNSIIVTAYYKIPSKQSHSWYSNYLRKYFEQLNHLKKIFFCNKEIYDELIHTIPINNTIFYILEFDDLPILKKYPSSIWETMLQYDVEKYHTKELGIIWACKKEFLNLAQTKYPSYNWYIWMDAGYIRDDKWNMFTIDFTNRGALDEFSPGVYLPAIEKHIEKKTFYKYPDIFFAAGMIVAHKNYIQLLVDEYDKMLDLYINHKQSITSDQYIFSSLFSSGLHNNWLHVIKYDDLSEYLRSAFSDKWFFLLCVL